MKNRALYLAVTLVLLSYGSRMGIAQQLSTSAPIIVNISEIDHLNINFRPATKAIDGATLDFYFQNMTKPQVDALVKDGVLFRRSVWIMDEHKIIAKCSLVGEAIYPKAKAGPEYGFTLGFATAEEANRVAEALKL